MLDEKIKLQTTKNTNQTNTQKIKAVFFDIDGTLISFKSREIPDSTVKAIKSLQEQGILVFVATGRPIKAVQPVRHLNFDGYVTFNGSACYDSDGAQLSLKTIAPQSIKRLLDHTENNELNFVLMYEDGFAVNRLTPELAASYTKLDLPIPPLVDRENPKLDSVLQANIFVSPQEETEFMQTIMPDCVSARWTPVFADVNPIGVSKKIGLELFCNRYNIEASEIMAFGDGGNDLAMLTYAGIGIAMGNAGEEVKAIANYVTTDVDNDGILNALLYYGVLQ